jgi:hypothetical protein
MLFCRDWFRIDKSEAQLLTDELAAERQLRGDAELRLRRADTARRTAERERDVYKVRIHFKNKPMCLLSLPH